MDEAAYREGELSGRHCQLGVVHNLKRGEPVSSGRPLNLVVEAPGHGNGSQTYRSWRSKVGPRAADTMRASCGPLREFTELLRQPTK
jgi:hypothetical protein